MPRRTLATSALVAAAWMTGVMAVADIDVHAVKQSLVLAEEPAGAVSLAKARATLGLKPKEIVVVGRIGGKGADPFLEGKASFSLLEIPADDHAKKPGHDADSCPFCKKRQANATMAAVQFLGEDGKPIPVDARKLLGIETGRDVVIRGQGIFDAKLGVPIIQVNADGIFIREQAE
jgi:bifunctional DNA-binding transcriptional regulator/antitoxin component of YhaV-PrlF toxin-antitoxin module